MFKIANYWKGKQSLASAYWIIHALFGFLLGILIFIGLATYYHKPFTHETLKVLKPSALAIGLPYTIFSAICVWRCANNTKSKFLAIVARILVAMSVFSGFINLIKL